MNQIIILTTDCEERVAYEIEDSQLKTLFQVLFMELSSYVDMQIPEFTPLYKIINSPIKVLKKKTQL
jgi:hypothetical protein